MGSHRDESGGSCGDVLLLPAILVPLSCVVEALPHAVPNRAVHRGFECVRVLHDPLVRPSQVVCWNYSSCIFRNGDHRFLLFPVSELLQSELQREE